MEQLEVMLTSMEVAEMVGKEHKNILRDIRSYCVELGELKIELVDFFNESTYVDAKGEQRPCYNVTKKGCEFISHKLTGIKGTEFTARYINRFHEMEDTIKNHIPQGSELIALAVLEAQKLLYEKDKQIAELKPKADFFDAVADSKTAISMNDVAKTLEIKGLGRNKLFELLRNESVLMKDNQPYQKYIDCGYFRVIEQKYSKDGEIHISFKTLVYQKGLEFIRKTVEKSI